MGFLGVKVNHLRRSYAVLSTALLIVAIPAVVVGRDFLDESDSMPPEKQAIFDNYAHMMSEGSPAPKDPGYTPPSGPRQEGIPAAASRAGVGMLVSAEDTIRPPGSSTDRWTNSWYQPSPDGWDALDVWAGVHGQDQEQGFLLIIRWSDDGMSVVKSSRIDTPRRAGAITITGGDGTILNLSAENGSEFRFDTATWEYVQS